MRGNGDRVPDRVPVECRVFALRCDPASVPAARHLVQRALRDWDLQALSDDASLATTELAANAVRHARTDMVLTVLVADRLMISVSDGRPGRLHASPSAWNPNSESGRGLFITDTLAQAWGTFPDRGGKVVWFTLALPDRADADLRAPTAQVCTHALVTERA